MALTGHQEAQELLLIEEADAWFEYLETTRGQSAVRYVEVEPWAWARLAQRLPVRIQLEDPTPELPFRMGLTAFVTVRPDPTSR